MKRLLAASLAALLIVMATTPAFAKPGKGKGGAAAVGASSIAIADGSDLRFGGLVSFVTVIDGLENDETAQVIVRCSQNGVSVYKELADPDWTFALGGSSSKWIANGGGPADCNAELLAYFTRGGITGARSLAGPIEFHAEG